MNVITMRFTKEGREIIELQRRLVSLAKVTQRIYQVREVMEKMKDKTPTGGAAKR